ncbi:putative membrane protein [Fermentimonas caenicola]|uniref:Putative membrane protein n=1 Tax=Fermentimonas caenicola TaxID=1562970 RepID=A0A098BYJ6_9BACT|nr:putative membrane protein [Fermentimonas caenicola]
MIMNEPAESEKQLLRHFNSFNGTVLSAIGLMIMF